MPLHAVPHLDSDTASFANATDLEVIVGFDGSRASLRAVEAARELVAQRAGRIHVIWVAHVQVAAALSADATAGIRGGLDAIERELIETASATLGPLGDGWSFERRDGNTADELSAAASELRDRADAGTAVVVVIGAARHAHRRLGGSVPGHLSHQRDFTLLVTPGR